MRASVGLAASQVHDADGSSLMVQVTDHRTRRVLMRGFFNVLADSRRPYVLRVGADVARQLRPDILKKRATASGQTFALALAFDRFGRGTFLLRSASEASTRELHISEELRHYLRSVRSMPESEASDEDA